MQLAPAGRAEVEATVAAAFDCLRAADVAPPAGAQQALSRGLSQMSDQALDVLVDRFTNHIAVTGRPEAGECAQQARLYLAPRLAAD